MPSFALLRIAKLRCLLELAQSFSCSLRQSLEEQAQLVGTLEKAEKEWKTVAELHSCPITREPITNEVINVSDGYKYERSAIETWLQHSSSSPMTRDITLSSDIVDLKSLCNLVVELQPVRARLHYVEDILLKETILRNEEREEALAEL